MRTGEVFGKRRLADGTLVTLRAPRADDLEKLLRFANSLVREKRKNAALGILMDKPFSRKEEEKFLTGVLAGIRRNDIVSVTAEVDDRIVGNTDLRRQRHRDVLHVGRLGIAILNEYRGMGLGKLLVETALERAERLGMTLVTLEVYASNEAALGLYRSMGFKELGRLPGGIRQGDDEIDLVHMFRQPNRKGKPAVGL